MKNFNSACLLILAVLGASLCGCSRKNDSKPLFRWTHISNNIDSLTNNLEYSYIRGFDFDKRKELTDIFSKATSGSSDPIAEIQRHYWQARLAKGSDELLLADSLTTIGMELCDSAIYPYEYARLKSLKASFSSLRSPWEAYRMSSENLKYFEQECDSFMTAATLMRLGEVMWSISDTVPASKYYNRANIIYTQLKLENYRQRNLLNIANTLDNAADNARCDSIMNFLMNSKIAQADKDFYHLVYRNAYFMTENFDYLLKAYQSVDKSPRNDAVNAFYESLIADYFLDEGAADSVALYAVKGLSKIDKVTDNVTKALIFNAMAFTKYMQGDVDASLDFYRGFLDCRLSIEKEHYSLQTSKDEYRATLERERETERQRHQRERAYVAAVFFAVIAICGVWVAVLYVRAQRAKISKQKGEVELQRHRNHLSACALAIEEKDAIINAVVKCVDRLSEEKKIGSSEAREITHAMKQYIGTQMERETFRELHEKLHPEFMKRLKADYPMLTESLLKHAAYISMGMTSKQISQALNIEYDSVKKSRSRLRQRMGLSPTDSLEDILRGYSN